MGWAVLVACLTGVGATWAGILLAYDSYYWGSAHQGLPVSFFIVAVIFAVYLTVGLPRRRAPARPRGRAAPGPADATLDQVAA
jgi:zinc/manganese transport system permease protein